MRDITLDNESTLLLQVSDDLTVCSLDVLALVLWNLGSESTSLIDGTRRNLVISDDTVSDTDSVIVVSPCWGLVDDTGTCIFGDVRVGNNSERSVLELRLSARILTCAWRATTTHLLGEVVKHWDVSPSDQILSLEATDLLELGLLLRVGLLAASVLLVDGAEQFLKQDEVLSTLEIVNLDVGEFGVDTECQVGRQGVWCGGPS